MRGPSDAMPEESREKANARPPGVTSGTTAMRRAIE